MLLADAGALPARDLVSERRDARDAAFAVRPPRVARHGHAGRARLPVPDALGLPGEVPPRAADDAGRAARPRRLAGRGRGPGARRRLARGVRPACSKGDVLVCKMTNPAWVVLFTKIGGLVTDAGGAASHPAVVAREFAHPGRRRHVDRHAGDQDGRPRARQRRRPAWSRSWRDRTPRPARPGQGRAARAHRVGRLPPGARLVETRIAQELGTSQAPVREALRDLEQLGLVVHEAYRGCSRAGRLGGGAPGGLPRAGRARGARRAPGGPAHRRRRARRASTRWSRTMAAAARARATRSPSRTPTPPSTRTIVAAAGNATLARQWSLLEPFARTYLTVQRARRRPRRARRPPPPRSSPRCAPATATPRRPPCRPTSRRPSASSPTPPPPPPRSTPREPTLVDLSMPVHAGMLTFPRVPPPALCVYESHTEFAERIGAAAHGVDSLTASYLVVQNDHVGTHCDARKHIVPTAGGADRDPARVVLRRRRVLDFRDAEKGHGITAGRGAGGARAHRVHAEGEGHRPDPHRRRGLQHRGALPHRPPGHDRGGHALADLAGRAHDGLRRHHVRPAGVGDVRAQAVLGGPPRDVGRGVLAPREPHEPRPDRPARTASR